MGAAGLWVRDQPLALRRQCADAGGTGCPRPVWRSQKRSLSSLSNFSRATDWRGLATPPRWSTMTDIPLRGRQSSISPTWRFVNSPRYPCGRRPIVFVIPRPSAPWQPVSSRPRTPSAVNLGPVRLTRRSAAPFLRRTARPARTETERIRLTRPAPARSTQPTQPDVRAPANTTATHLEPTPNIASNSTQSAQCDVRAHRCRRPDRNRPVRRTKPSHVRTATTKPIRRPSPPSTLVPRRPNPYTGRSQRTNGPRPSSVPPRYRPPRRTLLLASRLNPRGQPAMRSTDLPRVASSSSPPLSPPPASQRQATRPTPRRPAALPVPMRPFVSRSAASAAAVWITSRAS